MPRKNIQGRARCKIRLAGPRREVPATQPLTNPACLNDSRTLDTHASVATYKRQPIAPPADNRLIIAASDRPGASQSADGHAPSLPGLSNPTIPGGRQAPDTSDLPGSTSAGDGHVPSVGVSSTATSMCRHLHSASDPPDSSLVGDGHAPSASSPSTAAAFRRRHLPTAVNPLGSLPVGDGHALTGARRSIQPRAL